MLEFLKNVDYSLFFFINNGWSSHALDSIFFGLSTLGEWTIGIVAAATLASDGRRRLWRHAAILAVFLTIASAYNSYLKDLAFRPRPLDLFREGIARGSVRVNVLELHPLKQFSFPSGHAMLAFFFMTYVGQVKRPYRPYALLLAAGIAVSRVYVGAHFPSDCLVGAFVGWLCGMAAWLTFQRLPPGPWKTS